MKVICRKNRASELANEVAEAHVAAFLTTDVECLHYEIGKTYNVYGILHRGDHIWYYVCLEDGDSYPIPAFSGFFDVLDAEKPAYWVKSAIHSHVTMSFPEWANAPQFYENLVDGAEAEVKIFQQYKRRR